MLEQATLVMFIKFNLSNIQNVKCSIHSCMQLKTVSIESDGDIISLNHWTHRHVLLRDVIEAIDGSTTYGEVGRGRLFQ